MTPEQLKAIEDGQAKIMKMIDELPEKVVAEMKKPISKEDVSKPWGGKTEEDSVEEEGETVIEEEEESIVYRDPNDNEVACPEQDGKPMLRNDCKMRYGRGECECSEGDTNLMTIRCNTFRSKWPDSAAAE